MKNLVPKLSTCKKLKEAGWGKETHFAWVWSNETERYHLVCDWQIPHPISFNEEIESPVIYSPLTDELLGELTKNDVGTLEVEKNGNDARWETRRWILGKFHEVKKVKNKSLPEALAQLYLHLKKEELL